VRALRRSSKLGFGFDEDFWLRWSIRQAVSETMIIMVDANHACDATAAISRPHTRLRSIASANDPMTYVPRAKSPLFARSREIDPPDRLGGGGTEIPPPSSWRVRPNDARFLARNAAARASGGLPASKLLSSLENHRAWPRYRQRCGCVPPRLAPNRASDRSRSHRPAWVRDLARPGVASRCPRLAALVPP
jgi:hypothetical protein